jgi:glycosyltransferase involved in cell wall biosynthesis
VDTQYPLVSIIVRTKDRPKLLRRAMQSIAAQTYRPVEVILVNDGGCELDAGEIRTLLGSVSLNYVRLEENTGRAHAGNVGIENSTGSYIGFLDDDDEFYPDHLQLLVPLLNQTDYRVVYSDSLMVYKAYDTESYELYDTGKELLFSNDFDYNRLVFENYIPFMCLLFERETLLEAGGLDTSFSLYEDWDLLLRLAEKHVFYHLKKTTANYNQWSSDLQISQGISNQRLLQSSYIRIVSKHMQKITPERIHDYMSGYVHARALLKEKEAFLARLQKEIHEKDSRIRALQEEAGENRAQIDSLASELHALQVLMGEREALLHEKEALINAMRNTRGWRLLEKYRRLRNRTAASLNPDSPGNSLFVRGMKVLREQGLRAVVRKANKKFLFNKSVKNVSPSIEIPSLSSNAIESNIESNPLAARVSVIIPTKNAGEEFEYTLRKITQQEGIGEIELIVIDSGSDDGTVAVSRGYTENIVQIPPEDFHHAKTRNLGAEKATGEFLVFTVQDALPVGNQWLFKLLYPIEQGRVSAVSARQIPRSDADIFSCWSYWSHNLNYLGGYRDCICNNSLISNFDDLDMQAKRSMARLDSVSLGIRKSVFDEYRFNADYAEDLDLGIRMIKNGCSLLFQASNAVIHSHNRPAYYFLKRSYADTAGLWGMLHQERGTIPGGMILEASSYVYAGLKKSISALQSSWGNWKPSDLIDAVIRRLPQEGGTVQPHGYPLPVDQMVESFFKTVRPVHHEKIVKEIHGEMENVLRSLSEFVGNFAGVRYIERDLVNSIFKVFCLVAGYYLAANSVDEVDSLRGGV